MAERGRRRLLQRLLSGSKNIRFPEARGLCGSLRLWALAHQRQSSYLRLYVHADIPELVNLQNVRGKAKPYQVKQLFRLIEWYNLHMEEEP
jgi:hypothetical protein